MRSVMRFCVSEKCMILIGNYNQAYRHVRSLDVEFNVPDKWKAFRRVTNIIGDGEVGCGIRVVISNYVQQAQWAWVVDPRLKRAMAPEYGVSHLDQDVREPVIGTVRAI
eukprot:8333012-Lingulodinium_polyedra.AAC.1